jgi:hypothetical protein
MLQALSGDGALDDDLVAVTQKELYSSLMKRMASQAGAAAPAPEAPLASSMVEATSMDPASFADTEGKEYDHAHKHFVKAAKSVGHDADRASVLAAVAAPFSGTPEGMPPTGPGRAAGATSAKITSVGKPASIPSGTPWNLVFVTLPTAISFRTGSAEDHDNPDVIPAKIEAFRFWDNRLNGRFASAQLPGGTPSIANTEAFHNAVVIGVATVAGEKPDIYNWSSLPADRFFPIRFPEIFDSTTPYEIMGLSLKAVNTTPELYRGGGLVIGRQYVPPTHTNTMKVRTNFQAPRYDPAGPATTNVEWVSGPLTDVEIMPPSVLDTESALNLLAVSASADEGFLAVVPMNYSDRNRTMVRNGGKIAIFDEATSWNNPDTGEFGCPISQGLPATGLGTDYNAIDPCIPTCYAKLKTISDWSVFARFSGLGDQSSFDVSVHLNYLARPTRGDDPIAPFCRNLPVWDPEFLAEMTKISAATPLYSRSSENSFGGMLRGMAKVVKTVSPIARAGLSIASQMPGPVGARAQMADKMIKAVTGAKDGAKEARKDPSVARAALSDVGGGRHISHRHHTGGNGGAKTVSRVAVDRDGRGGVMIDIPKSRLKGL